jgi:hypothetical protein
MKTNPYEMPGIRSSQLSTRTQSLNQQVYRGDSSQHFIRQSSLQIQNGLQTLIQDGNRGVTAHHAFRHSILVTQQSSQVPIRTQSPIQQVYRGDSSQHSNRQSSLQVQNGLQTLIQEGNRGDSTQNFVRQSMPTDDPHIIIQQQNQIMHQLLAEKNELLAYKMATWEKEKEEEKKRMKVENDKLKLKQTYLAMKEKRQSQIRHQMINGEQNQIEKINFAKTNNPRKGFLKLGDDKILLNYLANNKEQQHFPYYWVDQENYVRCHCFGNPIAKWEEEKK